MRTCDEWNNTFDKGTKVNDIATHHRSGDQAHPEERLERSERGADGVRELFGDDREAWCEKGSIPERLDDSDNESEGDEHRVTWNAI